MDYTFTITDEARPYLVLQKGALDHLKHDPAEWDAAYNRSINNTFKTIAPFLPEKCATVLDIGSGMGGINALLAQHYSYLEVVLLDGLADAPKVKTHNQTFNDWNIARRFLFTNGVGNLDYIAPTETENWKGRLKFDVIISFGAWCFHFPPSEYLDFVVRHCKLGTVLILDVRISKSDWLEELHIVLGQSEIIRTTRKFEKRKFVYAG